MAQPYAIELRRMCTAAVVRPSTELLSEFEAISMYLPKIGCASPRVPAHGSSAREDTSATAA
jgi:hypothetical protein